MSTKHSTIGPVGNCWVIVEQVIGGFTPVHTARSHVEGSYQNVHGTNPLTTTTHLLNPKSR